MALSISWILWTAAGKISVGKQVDVLRLDMLIAMCVLGE